LFSEWIREYKEDVVDTAALQTEIDKFMTEYDEKIQTVLIKLIIIRYMYYKNGKR
jgi:hypothetical protein